MTDDDSYTELPDIHPHVVASNQVIDALLHLDRHPDSFVRWPYGDLDALTGPMGPGEVWYICAFSGGGKTTFVCSIIERWRQADKRVFVMPLELQPWRFRTYLACTALSIHPGDALSGNLRVVADGEAKRNSIKAALIDQAKAPYVDHVMIDEQRAINVKGLETGLQKAKRFGADVVIVDHIDHIEPNGGKSTNGYGNAVAVNDAALRMAQDNGMLLVCTSQLNNAIVGNGQDHLARYQPPREHHVLMGSKKREVCTGMIGLFRPIRGKRIDESPEEFVALVKKARKGAIEPHHLLEPFTMGVNAMKLRNYGSREGQRVRLGFFNGQVEELREADRWTTASNRPRQLL